MDHSRIEELARGPKDSVAELDSRMVELKSHGAGILACILYVRINQGCSLMEACDMVINSTVRGRIDAELRNGVAWNKDGYGR
jgi:ribosomal protein L7/L12